MVTKGAPVRLVPYTRSRLSSMPGLNAERSALLQVDTLSPTCSSIRYPRLGFVAGPCEEDCVSSP